MNFYANTYGNGQESSYTQFTPGVFEQSGHQLNSVKVNTCYDNCTYTTRITMAGM